MPHSLEPRQLFYFGLMAWVPALLLACLYWSMLGYRRDYLGHYLAGYGATLAGLCAVQAALTTECYGSGKWKWPVISFR